MAGVKGRSGGARPGAGRKPKAKIEIAVPASIKAEIAEAPEDDMLALLKRIALGQVEANANQVRAAVAAVQYTHTRIRDGGKKEEADRKAKEAASAGRFARPMAPKLVVSNG